MKNPIRLALLVVAAAVGTAACSFLPGGTAPDASALTGRTYLSTRIVQDGVPKILVKDTRIRINFDKDSLGASAGCNSMGGSYVIEGGALVVDALFMTEMACGDGLDEQDRWLADLLGAKPRVSLSGDELVLSTATITLTLVDRKVAEPDAPLVGIVWTVTTILEGDTASSIPAGVVATLVFGEDGQVAIETGCNSGGGAYKVDGNTVTFEPPIMTLRLCEGPEGQMESAVLAIVGAGAVTGVIDGDTLTLMVAGHGIMLSAATR